MGSCFALLPKLRFGLVNFVVSNSLSRMLRIHSPRGAIFRDVVVLYPLHYLDDTSLVVGGELDYGAFSLCYAMSETRERDQQYFTHQSVRYVDNAPVASLS